MADTSGMAELRGMDVDKLAKGFAEEELILKRFVTNSSTSAREIRWYQKTAGFLDSTDTTGITASQIANVAQKARPVVVEQSWTRQTSYIRKYFVESPFLSNEDIRDSDVDILAANIRDLVRAIENQVDKRIFDVIAEVNTAATPIPAPVNINSANVNVSGWGTASGSPIYDILDGKRLIRANSYNPEGAILYINPIEHRNLLNWLISTKGSSIPAFSSQKVETGVVMELLGCRIVVSQNATTNYALMFVPQRAATWKAFVPITARNVEEVGIGTKIRVWEEGECLLTDPKAVHLISGTALVA